MCFNFFIEKANLLKFGEDRKRFFTLRTFEEFSFSETLRFSVTN